MTARFAAMMLAAGSILSLSVAMGGVGPFGLSVPGQDSAQGKAAAAAAQPESPAPAVKALVLKPLDSSTTVFRDVNIVTMTDAGTLTRRTVVVKDGKIAQIEKELKALPEGAKVVECGGSKWMIPGLSDMHVHFPPLAGDKADAAWRAATLLLVNGVTTARGMVGHEKHIELRRRLVEGELLGPVVYVAGKPLTVQFVRSPEQAKDVVKQQKDAGFDAIKSHRVVVPEVYDAIQEAGKENGIAVTGHVDNEVGLEHALKAGMQIEHLDAMLAELTSDEVRLTFGQMPTELVKDKADLSKIPAVVKSMRDAKTWSSPTLALFERIADVTTPTDELKKRPELKYILPQARGMWEQQREDMRSDGPFAVRGLGEWFVKTRAAFVQEMKKQGVPMMTGSDSPQFFLVTGYALHDELEALVRAGLTPTEALKASTSNPADYLRGLPGQGSAVGIAPDFGRVEIGLRADLVLLTDDPTKDIANTRKIEGVVARGKWLDRAALDGLLVEVEKSVGG